MRLLVDECLSPKIARQLNATGLYEAFHVRDLGLLRAADYQIWQLCVVQDRILLTENAVDFSKLASRTKLHPGLIFLPSLRRERSWPLLEAALRWLMAKNAERPQDELVNSVLIAKPPEQFSIALLHG